MGGSGVQPPIFCEESSLNQRPSPSIPIPPSSSCFRQPLLLSLNLSRQARRRAPSYLGKPHRRAPSPSQQPHRRAPPHLSSLTDVPLPHLGRLVDVPLPISANLFDLPHEAGKRKRGENGKRGQENEKNASFEFFCDLSREKGGEIKNESTACFPTSLFGFPLRNSLSGLLPVQVFPLGIPHSGFSVRGSPPRDVSVRGSPPRDVSVRSG